MSRSSRSFKKNPACGVFVIDSAVMPVHSLYHTALSHHKQLLSPLLQGISQSGTAVSLMGQRDRAGCNEFHQMQADTAALCLLLPWLALTVLRVHAQASLNCPGGSAR